MWLFLKDPLLIPSTNNLAEPHIRKYVVYRKTAYFTRAERGERYLERMLSLFLIYRKKESPFQKLLFNISMILSVQKFPFLILILVLLCTNTA